MLIFFQSALSNEGCVEYNKTWQLLGYWLLVGLSNFRVTRGCTLCRPCAMMWASLPPPPAASYQCHASPQGVGRKQRLEERGRDQRLQQQERNGGSNMLSSGAWGPQVNTLETGFDFWISAWFIWLILITLFYVHLFLRIHNTKLVHC